MVKQARGPAHRTNPSIKQLVTQLLANKNQINEFMGYEKPKKIEKLRKYEEHVEL